MGWYVTCEICGTEEKYGLGCDCYEKEAEKNLARLQGCLIEESLVIDDGIFVFLVQKLRPPSGEVFYLRICIKDGGGEYSCWRKVKEITAESFSQLRDYPNGYPPLDLSCNDQTDETGEVGEVDEVPVQVSA